MTIRSSCFRYFLMNFKRDPLLHLPVEAC